MIQKPSITLIHQIPGRIRMRLACPFKDIENMKSIKGHEGIISVHYNKISYSILVYFVPGVVMQQEIILRVALALSKDYNFEPVTIFAHPKTELSNSAFYSGALLVVTVISKFLYKKQNPLILEWLAALGTTGAVLEHAVAEVNHNGNFDPEVLSVVYLISSMTKKNLLPASFLTWMTTFGRHLLHSSNSCIVVRPVEVAGDDGKPHYEIRVTQDRKAVHGKMTLFHLFPSILMHALGGVDKSNLLEQLRDLSAQHGNILEGLGTIKDGITLKIH